MNSWASDWGKSGYSWLPSEMLDWAEVAFATKAQKDKFTQLMAAKEFSAKTINFVKKKYRLD